MERSRKVILAALFIIFGAQFYPFEDSGHTTGTIDLQRHLISGLLPYQGRTHWQMYGGWSLFWIVIYAYLAYLFYTKRRSMGAYIFALLAVILTGLGSGTGGMIALVAILVAGYAIYCRIKEKPPLPPSGDIQPPPAPL